MSAPHSPRAGTTRSVPEGRYGSRARATPRRWRVWALAALGITVGVVLAYIAYVNLGPTPITGQRVAFEEKPGNAMEITVDVSRDEPAKPAVCIVRVRDISGAESGRKELYVPPGNAGTRLRTVIKSLSRPVTADVFGCSYSVPEYLSRRERPTG